MKGTTTITVKQFSKFTTNELKNYIKRRQTADCIVGELNKSSAGQYKEIEQHQPLCTLQLCNLLVFATVCTLYSFPG